MQRVVTEAPERTEVAVEEERSGEERNKHVSLYLVRFLHYMDTGHNKQDSNGQISEEIMEEKKDLDRCKCITYCDSCIVNYILSVEELVCLPANTESILSRNCSVGIDLCTVTHSKYDKKSGVTKSTMCCCIISSTMKSQLQPVMIVQIRSKVSTVQVTLEMLFPLPVKRVMSII